MNITNPIDVRNLMTGKDGCLAIEIDGVNQIIYECDTFQVQQNVSNTDYQPVGSILAYAVPTSVSYSLTYSSATVRDDYDVKPIMDAIKQGKIPMFNFQGKTEKPDGTEQIVSLLNCTPDGSMDLMNVNPGDILKRQFSFRINSVPDFIKSLTAK